MKTIDEIYKSYAVFISKGKKKGTYSLLDVVTHAMQEYANIQIELAVDKTLSVFVSNGKDSLEFTTLRTQILNEIKDR